MKNASTLAVILSLFAIGGSAVEPAAARERGPERPRTTASKRSVAPTRVERHRRSVEVKPTLWQQQRPLPAPRQIFDPHAPVVDVAAEAARDPGGLGDLDPTIDVQITQEIIDKAAQLGSVQAIYEFVRNECTFQAYYGSHKGAVETLRQRAGNDYDLASLLIALLRSFGVPARYAEGDVELTAEQARSWLAVDDGSVAGSILFTGGMEGVSIVNGSGGTDCCLDHGTPGCDDAVIEACVCNLDSYCCTTSWDQTCADETVSFGCAECLPDVVAVRAHRVWVEAFTSRGFGGATWVPLDPAFARTEVHPGLDVPEEMGFDAQAFVEEYYDPALPGVTLPRPETLVELLAQDVQAYLDTNHPGTTLDDVKRTHERVEEHLELLPASLPYTVRSRDGSFTEIPAARRYSIRFHLHDGATNLIDHTLNLPEIAGRRITIDYVGATPADQAIIDANGGIYQTPPSQVDLKPVLRLDGVDLAVGAAGVGMGLAHESDVHFLAPANGSGLPQNVVPSIFNTITTGAAQAIGLAVDGVADRLANPAPADDTEGLASLRFDTAMDYLAAVRNADLDLAQLMHAHVTTDVADAIVENVVRVTFDGFGVPQTFDWVGLRVDADRSVLGIWPVDRPDPPGAEPKDFLIVAGADGSLAESRIYEDSFGQDSVSTIKILELASDAGVPVYRRWNSLPLPPNTHTAATRQALQNAILSGHVVTFPADPMTFGTPGTGEWTGTGWIDMDPADGAAGYLISGNNNGGATVEAWPPEFIDLSQDDKDIVQVEITIVTPDNNSPDNDAIFTRDNEQKLTFEYTVKVTYDDGSMRTLPASGTYKRVTTNTTKTFRPGNYTFKIWISRRVWWFFNTTIAQAERKVSIVGALIRQDDGSADGQDPPQVIQAKCDHPPKTPKTKLKVVVIPATDPAGGALATAYNWSGGAKLSFKTPTVQATDLEPAGTAFSAAKDDQAVDVTVTLAGGKQVTGRKKFVFAAGGTDEKHKMTVFFFNNASIGVTAGGNYAIAGGAYTAVGGSAVSYSASADLAPAGLDCTLPEIKDLRIGILQNVSSTRVTTWGTPTIAWAGGVPAGTITAAVPNRIASTLTLPGTLNDSEASVAPLYDQPGKAQTLDANSLKPPGGCPGSGAATSRDTPSMPATPSVSIAARTAAGAAVGTVTYSLVSVVYGDNFTTWAVCFNTTTNELCALRQRPWTLTANSSAAGVQRANVGAAAAPTTPVTGGVFPNVAATNPANSTVGPVGAGTTTFTRP